MLCNLSRCAVLTPDIPVQKLRAEIQPGHTACAGKDPDLVIGQVPRMRAKGKTVGMGSDKRFFTDTGHIVEAALGQVGYVHKDAKLLHIRHCIVAEGHESHSPW